MGGVITEEAEITPAWLTATLREAGALTRGRVERVSIESRGASWSRNASLDVAYSADAECVAPDRLFLKICAGDDAVFGPSEVHYYTRDYLGHPEAPLPRCFGAAYRESPRAYHVLLEDLSETHVDGFQIEPDAVHGRSVAEALARLHAPHWGAAGLGRLGMSVAGPREIDRYFGWIARGFDPFVAEAGGLLDGAGRAVLDRVFSAHPAAMRRRAERPDGFTLVHGDINPGNVLVPRNGAGPVYLIDRQPFDWSLVAWLAVSDLAIWMILHWETEVRRALEEAVLRHYAEALTAAGVTYAWNEVLADYRFSVAQCVEFAVEWCVLPEDRTRMRWLWERQLQRALAAWEDHACDELYAGEG